MQAGHSFKVNFCKFTNETRCAIEDATSRSGQRYIAALNGTASGGGYELASACAEIYLVDSLLTGNWAAFTSAFAAIWLPAFVLGFSVMAPIMRIARQGMIEALDAPPTVALRALGAKPSSIVFRHALKNAMLPVLTMIAIVYGYLLGGSVLVETIFSWPGMGLYVYNSIGSSDFPAVQGFILYATTMYVIVFLLLDLVYLALDPRVKY